MFSAKAILSLKQLINQCFLLSVCMCSCVSIYAVSFGVCVCVCVSGKAFGCLYEAEECIHAEMTNWEI